MRIFLCDDSRSFSAAVGFWLEEADDLDLVGVAHDRDAALAALPGARADVVLLDTMVVGHEHLGVDDVRAAADAGAKVVVYSGHDPAAARQFVRGEPDGFLAKGDEPDHLIDALRALVD